MPVPWVRLRSHPLARMAPRALLVATDLADPATQSARRQLVDAGFADVMVLHSGRRRQSGVDGSRP